jgi:hypothetical protein
VPHLIATTMQPDKKIEVTDTEYLDLSRQGLVLIDYTQQATAPAPAASKKAAAAAANKEG